MFLSASISTYNFVNTEVQITQERKINETSFRIQLTCQFLLLLSILSLDFLRSTHNLKKSSSWFGLLLSKCTNHEEDFFLNCVFLRKSELYLTLFELGFERYSPLPLETNCCWNQTWIYVLMTILPFQHSNGLAKELLERHYIFGTTPVL